ncbi:MAG: amidohydrolase, partial [Bacillota bacterium]|nr:amidohydrolase [Bacillota bacterium]
MKTIDEQLQEIEPFLIDVRRSIHAHPEKGFMENRTSGIVRQVLEECGAEIKSEIAQTGVTGLIRGGQPGPVIGLRLDMDAIAVTDEKTVCYKSSVDGLSHACGHDVHTAVGLGLAKIIAMNRANVSGAVKLIFQPAEEVPFEHTLKAFDRYREAPAGRRGAAMAVAAGVLAEPDVDMLLGFHCWPELQSGNIGYQSGASMAGTGNFHLEITGSGGHAATPHLTVDPIVISAQVIGALQTLASRRIKPGTPFVLTIGTIKGGVRRSVIANSVDMTGTVRSNDEDMLQEFIPAEMERLINGITQASGAAYTFNYAVDVPPVINNDALLQVT